MDATARIGEGQLSGQTIKLPVLGPPGLSAIADLPMLPRLRLLLY